MRVLIQDCDSLKFFAGQSIWVDSPVEAQNFGSSIPALQYIRRHALPRAQIVLKFSSDDLDVVLPSAECDNRVPA